MISNRTSTYAKMLNFQGHRHPIVKIMLTVFEILSEVEERKKTDEDPERFLSTLGFSESDRRQLLKKTDGSYYGQGYFSKEDAPEILDLIGLTKESVKVFGDYNVVLEIFSLKSFKKNQGPLSVEDILEGLHISKEGRGLLTQMTKLFSGSVTTLYYRYFKFR